MGCFYNSTRLIFVSGCLLCFARVFGCEYSNAHTYAQAALFYSPTGYARTSTSANANTAATDLPVATVVALVGDPHQLGRW